ncbi:MAG: hypothetical protein AAFQ77_03745 [Myxococcota bacterium]
MRDVERAEAEARRLEAEFMRAHGNPNDRYFTVPETARPPGLELPPLAPPLKRKIRRIKTEIAAGGEKGVAGTVTPAEAHRLGLEFVGPGARLRSDGQGLISADGLRQYRFPSTKSGRNPVDGEPWSATGRQANYESRPLPRGKYINNVHLDVK